MIAPPQARATLGQFLLGNEEVGYRIGVPHVWPSGSSVTITGQATTGQNLTGATPPPAQFGTVTIKTSFPQTKVVGGIASAQAFGVVTRITGGVISSSSGVPSAQAFGSITVKTVVSRAVTGLVSEQAFGTPTTKAVVSRAVSGLASEQAFGALTVRTSIVRPSGGVSSAQAFGTPTTRAVINVAVGAVGSAQSLGVPTIKAVLKLTVVGLASEQVFGVPTVVRASVHVLVGGLASPQGFGTVTIRAAVIWPSGGVPSAQWFGAVTFQTRVTAPVFGLASEQAFGAPQAYIAWLHDLSCLDDDLAALACLDEELAALVCLEPSDLSICGEVICADGHVCGGLNIYAHTSDCLEASPVEAVLNEFLVGGMRVGQQAVVYVSPSPPPFVLDLQPAGVT